MRARDLLTAEGALVLGGLGIAAVGPAVDVWSRFAGFGGAPGAQPLAFGTLVTGLAFVAFGLFMAHARLFARRGFRRLYVASFLLVADGLIHMSGTGFELGNPGQAILFAGVAAVEIPAGLALAESSRTVRDVWLYLALALLTMYVASRALSLPVLFGLADAEGLAVASKILQVLLIGVLLSMRDGAFDTSLRRERERT